MKISPGPGRTLPDHENKPKAKKTIFWGQKSISGHEKSILNMKIRLPSMKNRSRSTKMGPRSRPRPPRPRKTQKTVRKPRKNRKFENLGSADGAKPLVFRSRSGIWPDIHFQFQPVPVPSSSDFGQSRIIPVPVQARPGSYCLWLRAQVLGLGLHVYMCVKHSRSLLPSVQLYLKGLAAWCRRPIPRPMREIPS